MKGREKKTEGTHTQRRQREEREKERIDRGIRKKHMAQIAILSEIQQASVPPG